MKIIVIGGGPAGEAAAKVAARRKAKVLLVEKDALGGLCLNRGCIPSKTLLAVGKKIYEFKKSSVLQSYFALKHESALPDGTPPSESLWESIQQKKNQVIEELRRGLSQTLQREGVETIYGTARFLSPTQVCIAQNGKEQTENFDKCIIAVGSKVFYPPPFHPFQNELLDSDKVIELERLPSSMAIVGGGAVGCEYACLFHELGVKIVLIEMTPSLLPGEDAQISRALCTSFEKRGIEIFLSATVQNISKSDGLWKMTLSNNKEIQAKTILICAGRKPNFDSLDLAKAQIQHSPKGITVNKNLQTSNPNVYAIGDVNGLSLLAHAGTQQGEIASEHALGENKNYDGSFLPRCLYTWPEVASVGMWQYQAQAEGIEVKSQKFFFQASGRAQAEGDAEGFIQLISEKKSQKILGAQIIGPCATELIHIISVALKSGMSQPELKDVIFAHPTFAEGIRSALER